MAKCPGLHCDGCGSGSGLGPMIAAGVLLLIIAGTAETIVNALRDLLMIVLIGAGSIAAGTVIVGGTVIMVRRSRERSDLRAHARESLPVIIRGTVLPAPERQRPALPAPSRILAPRWPDRPALRVVEPSGESRADRRERR